MSLSKLMKNYTQYNAWVNEQYKIWLEKKPEALLKQEVPSSYTSILSTLNHIWAAQEFYSMVIGEKSDHVQRYMVQEFKKDEILEGLDKNSKELAAYVQSCDDKDLEKSIHIKNEWLDCNYPKYEYIQHVINHGTYHRGQVVTIGRNLGITDAPMTDFIFYKRG